VALNWLKTSSETGSATNVKPMKKTPPKLQLIIAILSLIALAIGYALDEK
jgi:hypothetical protein